MKNVLTIAISVIALLGLYSDMSPDFFSEPIGYICLLGPLFLAASIVIYISFQENSISLKKNKRYANEPHEIINEFDADSFSNFDGFALCVLIILFILIMAFPEEIISKSTKTYSLHILFVLYGIVLNILYGIKDDIKMKRRSRKLREVWNQKEEMKTIDYPDMIK